MCINISNKRKCTEILKEIVLYVKIEVLETWKFLTY